MARVALERLLTKCLYGNVYCGKSSLIKKRPNDFYNLKELPLDVHPKTNNHEESFECNVRSLEITFY